ncbi:hypothetical protein E6O75_ATG08756 [Venturia nashicola]|uniref:Uncharacterized protein n=1 Tax=Venturia nashicola TaxID=86259 RepID=A0A4Z1P0H7_9PEZI|nr:hypothetical protein E6O75_ATG08756 [Venturia nashicola]
MLSITSRFFVLDLDYGHELCLNQLNQQKFTVIRALERLEKRAAEVLYKKQKWFNWVRQCQEDEEKQAENEKEKIKREAALFRRQWKQVEQRLRVLRAKEEQKRQDAYLDKAYEERMLELEDMDVSDWDPIEDFTEDKRAEQQMAQVSISDSVNEEQREEQSENLSALEPSAAGIENEGASKKKKRNNKKKAAANVYQPGQSNSTALVKQTANNAKIPDKTLVKDEIDTLMSQIVEIKHLLFCRLLLTHATLLPIALHADSVGAFLADTEVSEDNLRDLCLQMEQPDLQQLRDACADLTREDDHDDAEMCDDEEEEPSDLTALK